jgi:hypothetical protein
MQTLKDERSEVLQGVLRQRGDLLGPGAYQLNLVVIERQDVKGDRDENESCVGDAEQRQAPCYLQALPVQPTLRPATAASLKVQRISARGWGLRVISWGKLDGLYAISVFSTPYFPQMGPI